MCLAVYLVSSEVLTEIPWNYSKRAFHLESAQREAIAKWVKGRLLYYAGSHQRCGCGYQKSNIEPRDLASVQANYIALSGVVGEPVSRGASIEVVACFNEFASATPDITGEIQSTDIRRADFELKEGQHFRVVARSGSPARRGI
jgi:hypothetical protein